MNAIHYCLVASVTSLITGLYLLRFYKKKDEIRYIREYLFYGIKKNMLSLNLRIEKKSILFSLPDNKQDDISLFFQHVLKQLGYVVIGHTPYFENGFNFTFKKEKTVFVCCVRRLKNRVTREYLYSVIIK